MIISMVMHGIKEANRMVRQSKSQQNFSVKGNTVQVI